MQVGDLVTSRWHISNIMGVVKDIGYHNGEHWADVHWIFDCSLTNIHFIDDLEVLCITK